MTDQEFNDPLEGLDPILEGAFSAPGAPVADPTPPPVEATPPVPAAPEAPEPVAVSDVAFPPITQEPSKPVSVNSDVFGTIPVDVTVELGRAQISLKDVYELAEGSIIELNRFLGEPLDVVVNGQVIARGEVVAIDDHYAIRVTKVVAKSI